MLPVRIPGDDLHSFSWNMDICFQGKIFEALLTFPYNFFCSGWRCNKYHPRPNFDVCLPHGCHWCRSCSCHFPVGFTSLPVASRPAYVFQSVLTTPHSIFFFRYLITMILICRLVQQVDVIPPSLKSLKFGRFLGCGEIQLEPWNWITSLTGPLEMALKVFCFLQDSCCSRGW